MSILTVENLTHGFGARRILQNASFRLLNGEHIGLVGANGEGKTTFLDIVTGKLMPDEGKVEWCKRVTTGYLDQNTVLTKGQTIRDVLRGAFDYMFKMEQEMIQMYDSMATCSEEEVNRLMDEASDISHHLEHNGFYIIDSKIEEVAYGLGLGEIGLDRDVNELSGGQRSKVLLTKLLLQNPMILILDEPTNFLDENHIAWLKDFLKNYDNAFLLVSHDIPFLNDVVNVVYHVENAILTRYTGNHDNFLVMYELKKRQTELAYGKQQKEIEQLEVFIAKNKARASTSNMAKSRQKKLDKIDIIEIGADRVKPKFKFIEARTPGKVIIQTSNLVLGYDEPLTCPLNFTLERGNKIAIKGVNGVGKSTLLKTLLGIIPPVSGSCELDTFLYPQYFEQEAVATSTTAFDEILNEFPSMTNGEVRSILARCGLTREHIMSQMKVLSGGENAKVRLCKLMNKEANFLVLDEPTNHLDVFAKESLKEALIQFKGTILVVSHEPDFYEDWVTDIWNVENWTTKIV